MDRGDWRAIVHRVAKNGTQLEQLSTFRRSGDPFLIEIISNLVTSNLVISY